jgi:hypothetical protein
VFGWIDQSPVERETGFGLIDRPKTKFDYALADVVKRLTEIFRDGFNLPSLVRGNFERDVCEFDGHCHTVFPTGKCRTTRIARPQILQSRRVG